MGDARAYIKSQKHFDEYKESIISTMIWHTPKRGGKSQKDTTKDVSISTNIAKDSRSGKSLCITFRNEVQKLIDDKEINKIAICCTKNRCYFKATSDGYKLLESGNRVYTKMFYQDNFENFLGDYDLKYDDFLDLYYIEVSNGGSR